MAELAPLAIHYYQQCTSPLPFHPTHHSSCMDHVSVEDTIEYQQSTPQQIRTTAKLSAKTVFACAKWVQFILLVIYACMFAWEVLYLPQSSVAPVRKGGGSLAFSSPSSFNVDILSVATISRLELLDFQKRTFASHGSVRNFFNATEVDDYDPTCYKDLTWEHVIKVARFCHNKEERMSYVYRFLRGKYARKRWLEKKANPVGWLCAIQRPYAGLRKAYNHYQEKKEALPDYFIILDDDSYFNMDAFQRNHEDLNSSESTVVGGCVVREPIRQINFTFPFGGFGTIFSKGSLEYLFHPTICPSLYIGRYGTIPMIVKNHANSEAICNQLSKDLVGELKYFEQGMSLFDLIYKYVNTERYRDVDKWKTGFCMHSDWVIGFFVNFYNVSTHVKNQWYNETRHARIEAYRGSNIYAKGTGACNNQGNCKPGSEICHYATADWMEEETKRWL